MKIKNDNKIRGLKFEYLQEKSTEFKKELGLKPEETKVDLNKFISIKEHKKILDKNIDNFNKEKEQLNERVKALQKDLLIKNELIHELSSKSKEYEDIKKYLSSAVINDRSKGNKTKTEVGVSAKLDIYNKKEEISYHERELIYIEKQIKIMQEGIKDAVEKYLKDV